MGRETYSQWIRRQLTAQMIRHLAALPEEKRQNRFAGRVVDLWSSRLARDADPLFVPTIGAATRAGRPWLSYICHACMMVGKLTSGRLIGIPMPRSSA